MDIKRENINVDGVEVPSIVLTPDEFKAVAIVIHGYGGSKEEELGLSYRVAAAGFKTFAIDFRGHGENSLIFDENILLDLENLIRYCKEFGKKVVTIGHSLGGRISLVSKADYAIGISPALNTVFSEETMKALTNLRNYRTNLKSQDSIKAVMKKIPTFEFVDDYKRAIIYGSRDIPEIISVCSSYRAKAKNTPVIEIENALHSDICSLEVTFESVVKILNEYFERY